MKSNKFLILTLSSIFIIVALLVSLFFIILGVYNNYCYSSSIKSVSLKHKSEQPFESKSKTKIRTLGKVTFLLGNTKIKTHATRDWKKVTYGQHLSRGDSLRLGIDSKLEIRTKTGETITLQGFQKIRIDNSLLSLNQNGPDSRMSTESKNQGGKIARLTGKEEKSKETSPVSAIRSNKPIKGKETDKNTKLKTQIGN